MLATNIIDNAPDKARPLSTRRGVNEEAVTILQEAMVAATPAEMRNLMRGAIAVLKADLNEQTTGLGDQPSPPLHSDRLPAREGVVPLSGDSSGT